MDMGRPSASDEDQTTPRYSSKPHLALSAPVSSKRDRIEISLASLEELFHPLDPSPFRRKDLDPDAEAFLLGWVQELPGRHALELLIHLPAEPASERIAGSKEGICNHFASQAKASRQALRALLRHGRSSLLIGLGFMTACLLLSDVIAVHFQSTLAQIFHESLLVGGWVAMWHPIQIYLYDWWPILNRARLYDRMSRMQITVRSDAAGCVTDGPARNSRLPD